MQIKSWKWNRAWAIPLLVAIATPAIGAGSERFSIYGWQDDAGVEHYTNELADVPEAYRNRVAALVKDWVAPEPPPKEDTVEHTTEATHASPTPVQASSEAPQADVTDLVDASQNSSVVRETRVVTQQPLLFDDTLLPAGGSPSFAPMAQPPREVFQPAGPIPRGAAGPLPLGAAGPPTFGAAGPPPLGAAGHPPVGFAGRRR